MKSFLEIIRIVLISLIFAGFVSIIIQGIYNILGISMEDNEYYWLFWIAIFLLFFVFYRNRLQFSGWYRGKGMKKLPNVITYLFIFLSILLFIVIPFLNS